MGFERHEIEWTAEKSRRLWDYYGSNPRFRSTFFGYLAGPMVALRILAACPVTAGARILDFSCGQGDIIASLLKLMQGDQKVHASDFTDTYVSAVSQRFAGNARFEGATLFRSLPSQLPSASFDLVYATEVIEHLTDDELTAMLNECKRLLRPGGRLFLTTPNEEDYEAAKQMCPDCGCIYHKWQHLRTWTAQSLQQRIEASKFRTVTVEAVAWLNWRGKLMSLLTTRRIDHNNLVYIGERVA